MALDRTPKSLTVIPFTLPLGTAIFTRVLAAAERRVLSSLGFLEE